MTILRLNALVAALLLAAVPAFAATPGVPAFVVDGGTRVTLKNQTKLTLNCDLRNYSTFTPSAGSAVVVNGYLSPSLIGVTNFADLTIASHGVAGLATNASVNGTLTLTSGWLSVAAHDLTANTIVGGSAASYVITPDTLSRLVRIVSGSTNTLFPVGNSAYNPVSVRTGSGVDIFRIAAIDAPPTTGMTAASPLTRRARPATSPGARNSTPTRWARRSTAASATRTARGRGAGTARRGRRRRACAAATTARTRRWTRS